MLYINKNEIRLTKKMLKRKTWHEKIRNQQNNNSNLGSFERESIIEVHNQLKTGSPASLKC